MSVERTAFPVSVNTILALILPIAGTIIASGTSVVQTSGGYFLPLSLWAVFSGIIFLILENDHTERGQQRLWRWLMISTTVLIVGFFIRQLVIRPNVVQPRGIYDGAIQAEVAADLILQGKNPYGANYKDTEYGAVNTVPSSGVIGDNPVWYHYIYPPLTFLIILPFRVAGHIFWPLGDYRMVTISALYFLNWLLLRHVQTREQKITIVLLTLGNPLFWVYTVIGCNEILMSLAVAGSMILLHQKKWLWSGIAFGLAIAAKQVIWLIAPLWLAWLWLQYRHGQIQRREFLRVVIGAIGSAGMLFIPFIIWNPVAAWTDMVRFAGGSIPNTYPIAGTTILQYLHVFHLIPSPWSVIPVYLFQLLVAIPMYFLVLRWVKRDLSPSRWLVAAAVVLLSLMLVSRYTNNNFFMTPLAFLITAYVLQQVPQSQECKHV